MGRLVGLPYFSSEEAFSEEKADASAIRKAKASGADQAESDEAAKRCQTAIALRMRGQFEERIIHRTGACVNWENKRLLSLPPYEETLVIVKLTGRETTIMGGFVDTERYVARSLP